MNPGNWKILIEGKGIVDLELYVGVITLFAPPKGDLACRQVILLAEDTTTASVLIARKYPNWDLQSLTCVTDLPWFTFITLDSNCPELESLRTFQIKDIEAVVVPDDSEDGTFRRD